MKIGFDPIEYKKLEPPLFYAIAIDKTSLRIDAKALL